MEDKLETFHKISESKINLQLDIIKELKKKSRNSFTLNKMSMGMEKFIKNDDILS
jgi:hypothetical protein